MRGRFGGMKKKSSSPSVSSNLPVSKQTAGGVAGAIVGGVIAGPVGAVAGAIAGTIMGNRAAHGKTLVSSGTTKAAANAVRAVKDKLPMSKSSSNSPKARPGKVQPAKSASRKQKSSAKAAKAPPAAKNTVSKRK